MTRILSVLAVATPLVASAQDEWTLSCTDVGEETFGMVLSAAQLEPPGADPWQHVVVYRRLPGTDSQFRFATRQAEAGMPLCTGDLLETWHGTEVTLFRMGADRRGSDGQDSDTGSSDDGR